MTGARGNWTAPHYRKLVTKLRTVARECRLPTRSGSCSVSRGRMSAGRSPGPECTLTGYRLVPLTTISIWPLPNLEQTSARANRGRSFRHRTTAPDRRDQGPLDIGRPCTTRLGARRLCRVAEGHRWAGLGFHPRRCLLAVVARGGAYCFGSGYGSRTGSGLSFARIAWSI